MQRIFSLLPELKNFYDLGLCYFEGEIAGEKFKIRMNKDHARNPGNDDNVYFHNLSLVSENILSARVFRKSGNKLQWQVENIYSWERAEEQIIEFLGAILDEVEG